MDGEAQRPSVTWEKGSLAPVDRLRPDRADSPTPGLVEGTEPGAVQKSAFFVHAHSFEDLTAEAEAEQEGVPENSGRPEDEPQGLVGEKTIPERHSKDLSPQSRSKEEDMSNGCKVVFLTKKPLVLVGVSQTPQSEKELLRELQYIYYQIVSLLTLTQLNHIFQRKQNYDLRRLLAGSEYLTDNLLHRLDRDPGLLLSAVTCLPLPSSVRDVVSSSLQAAKAKDLVFSILLAGDRLVTLVRKRDQFLHHIDLHLVLNLVGSSSSFREGEGWTPICLPKFNTAGFFHAHISYLEPASELCLILVSTEREDFFNMSNCKRRFLERLTRRSAYQALKEALKCPSYSVEQVGIPELRHFLYKSKSSGLYTSPEFPELYQSDKEQERLMGLYQELHSHLHHPVRPLRFFYCCSNQENLLAWVSITVSHHVHHDMTNGFELYLCFSPLGTKALAVSAINKLLKWIRKEEDRLFILSPLTY
ncbi:unnamed protein product [Tetraodon nigroviridis]|uniref:Vacuolar fusion protein MON1 homolog n=1 Tax=Tetraodon nigroviridis TaxID=99883 RepID=Q4SR44_TETNG|nr:unnamed protein product [Tetraodon nigroviridis]